MGEGKSGNGNILGGRDNICKGPVVGGRVAILVTGESEEEPRGVANRRHPCRACLYYKSNEQPEFEQEDTWWDCWINVGTAGRCSTGQCGGEVVRLLHSSREGIKLA